MQGGDGSTSMASASGPESHAVAASPLSWIPPPFVAACMCSQDALAMSPVRRLQGHACCTLP